MYVGANYDLISYLANIIAEAKHVNYSFDFLTGYTNVIKDFPLSGICLTYSCYSCSIGE